MNFYRSLTIRIRFPTPRARSFAMLLSCPCWLRLNCTHSTRSRHITHSFWKWDWIIVGTWVMTLIIMLAWHGGAVTIVFISASARCCDRLLLFSRVFQLFAAVDIHKIFHFIVSSVSSSERVALLFPPRQTTNFRCTERGERKKKKQQISHTHENLIYEPKLICKHSARENVQQKRVLNRNFISSSSSLFLQPCKSDDVAVRCRSDEAGLPQSLLDLVKVFKAEFPWSARSRCRHSGRFRQVSMMRWCARERDQP